MAIPTPTGTKRFIRNDWTPGIAARFAGFVGGGTVAKFAANNDAAKMIPRIVTTNASTRVTIRIFEVE